MHGVTLAAAHPSRSVPPTYDVPPERHNELGQLLPRPPLQQQALPALSRGRQQGEQQQHSVRCSVVALSNLSLAPHPADASAHSSCPGGAASAVLRAPGMAPVRVSLTDEVRGLDRMVHPAIASH